MEVALVDVAGALIALVSMLVAFVFYPTVKTLVFSGLGELPLGIGQRVKGQVDDLIAAAYRAAAPWAAGSIALASRLILAPYNYFSRLLHWTVLLHQALAINAYAIVAIRIPQAYVDLSRLTYTIRDQLLTYVDGWVNALQGLTYTIRDQLLTYVDGWVNALQALTYTVRDQVLSYVDGTAAAERAYAEALQRQALAYDEQVRGEALGAAERARVESEAYARAGIEDALRGAERARVESEAYARAVGQALGSRLEQLEASPCLQHCAELGGLGSDLAGLNLAEILLLLVQASRDPGTGRERILGQVLAPAQRITDDVKRLVGAL